MFKKAIFGVIDGLIATLHRRPFSVQARVPVAFLVTTACSVFGVTAVAPGGASAAMSFRVTDLGTLGGTDSSAVAINDNSEVIGISNGEGFFWTPTGGMVDLGTLDPAAINSNGEVVGYSGNVASEWTQSSGMVDLGTLWTESGAVAVNNNGEAVGWSNTSGGLTDAVAWTPVAGIADLGRLTMRNPYAGYSNANAVNDNGEVVGSSMNTHVVYYQSGCSNCYYYVDTMQAVMWQPSQGIVDIGDPVLDSTAVALNNNGEVVGWSDTASGNEHAFEWTPTSGMVDLGTLGGADSSAVAINDTGEVVGTASTTSGATHAVLWQVLVPTATHVSSSANPSVYGQSVTFTATVSPTDGGGTVAFYADGSATPITGCGTMALSLDSGVYLATCTTSLLGAGTHTISATYSGDSAYQNSSADLSGGQQLDPAPLTVTAPSATILYGAQIPPLDPTYSGFVNGDNRSSLSPQATCTTTATSTSPGGTYPVTCSGAVDPNYTFTYVPGTLTIDQSPSFIASTPPLTATARTVYSYTFTTTGFPAPAFSLGGGAPSWLSINSTTGTISGTAPNHPRNFTYSVTATNPVGSVTAGPFRVALRHGKGHHYGKHGNEHPHGKIHKHSPEHEHGQHR